MTGRRSRLRARALIALAALMLAGLSFAIPTVLIHAAPPQKDAPAVGVVSGQVRNGTDGASVPADLRLTLFIFDAALDRQQYETTADAQGNFRFEGILLNADHSYVVTTAYRDRVFTSALASPQDGAAQLEIPLTIYELTEDPSIITITSMVTQVNATDSALEVAQSITFVNRSDRAFSTSQTTADGRPISVVISLPPGAFVTGFQEPDRFLVAQEQYAVVDTLTLLPGRDHLIQLLYVIDYQQDAIIEQQVNYALDGTVRLLVSPASLRVTSDQLRAGDSATIGSTAYQSFSADLALDPGDVVRFDLSGAGPSTAAGTGSTASSNNNTLLLILAAAVGAAVTIAIALLRMTGKRDLYANKAAAAQIDALAQQIAVLDARHHAGAIDSELYQEQRAALKAQLAALMNSPQDENS